MDRFEYKVIAAPRKGEKARGVKTTADRFALALTGLMNEQGRDGWEYVRADTLPCEERVGLTGKASSFQHVLVFRRRIAEAATLPANFPAPRPEARPQARPETASAPAPGAAPRGARDDIDAPLPEPDALDAAARSAMFRRNPDPVIARPEFGRSPRLPFDDACKIV